MFPELKTGVYRCLEYCNLCWFIYQFTEDAVI